MNHKAKQDFPERETGGKLAENIMHFARVLRGAGLPVGPGQVLDALEAAQTGCLKRKNDFYAALHSVFVKRHEHDPIFEQAFHVFWCKPKMMEQLIQLLLPQISRPVKDKRKQAGHRRLAEALFDETRPMHAQREEPPGELELDANYTFSSQELLRKKDFEQMTVEEQVRAKRCQAHAAHSPNRVFRLHRAPYKDPLFSMPARNARPPLPAPGRLPACGHAEFQVRG